MTFSRTAFDKINEDLSSPLRKLQDIFIDIVGTKTSLLRITSTSDLLGNEDYTLNSYLISNAIVNYPFSDIETFVQEDSVSSHGVDSINMWDILPIEVVVPIDSSVSTSTEAVNFNDGDILLDVKYDQEGNKIPILMQVSRVLDTFLGKRLIKRKYEATLYRGTLETAIQTIVDNYVSNLGIPEIESSTPTNGTSGVAVDTTIVITFNVSMDTGSVEDNITITPSGVIYTTSWDSDEDTITLTPTEDLASGVTHTINIATGTESSLGVASETIQTIQFVTLV